MGRSSYLVSTMASDELAMWGAIGHQQPCTKLVIFLLYNNLSYTKYVVHSYTVDVVFTLSYEISPPILEISKPRIKRIF